MHSSGNQHSRLARSCIGLLFFALAACQVKAADSQPGFPDPVLLPAPTERVVFRKELLSKHPRIYIDAAGVGAFRRRMDAPAMVPLMSSFLAQADEAAAETPPVEKPGNSWAVCKIGYRLERIAFACLATRKPQYLEGSRKWLHAVLNYPDTDKGTSELTYGMALTYDWLYNDLSPEERRQLETALLRNGRLTLETSAKAPNNYPGGSYFMSYSVLLHTAISTVAMALYDKAPGEMQGWLDYTRSRFQPTYLHLPKDGGYHEGAPHLTFAAAACLRYIESLRSISGEDLGDMPYLQDLTKRILDIMVMPDGRNLANVGDCDVLGGPPEDEIYTWLCSHNQDGHAEWLRQNMRKQFVPAPPVNSPFALIWSDPSIAPKAPDDLPTVGLYEDLGEVAFRSSWKDDAAVVVFRCGPPGGHYIAKTRNSFPGCAFSGIHYNPDANTFLFWSDKQWRIGDPGGYTLDKQTHTENVWMVGGKGQRGGDGKWFDPKSYFVPGIAQPHLVRVASSPAADYAIGEAAPAYETECKLTEFKRHLLFVKGDKPYVVVYDRLRAGEAKSWASYLHTFVQIDAADNRSFSAAGSCLPGVSCGVVLGPAGITLDAHPLNVFAFAGNRPVDRGFELVARPPGTSESTWLVTVVGVEKSAVTLGGSDQAPFVTVGKDQIAWAVDGTVAFNGKTIQGNLLAAP